MQAEGESSALRFRKSYFRPGSFATLPSALQSFSEMALTKMAMYAKVSEGCSLEEKYALELVDGIELVGGPDT